MRYQDRIYIQNAHSCVRNKDHLNMRMSSDICVFNKPIFIMNGADKIMTGTTVSDDEVHIIESQPTIDLTFTFTENLESFANVGGTFKYKIYKFKILNKTKCLLINILLIQNYQKYQPLYFQ